MKEFSRFRPSSHGSFIVDRQGTIIGFDEAMEALTGWPAVEVVGHHKDFTHWMEPAHEAQTTASLPLYDGALRAEPESRNLELALNCRDRRRIDVESTVRHLEGPGERTQVTVLRILSRSASGAASSGHERRDSLTGLCDRDYFSEQLGSDFRAAATSARPLALVVADVDHLREINDRLGHEAGNEVLRKLAGILRVSVEDERRIARVGDDDFAMILPDSGRGDARQVAAGLRSTVARYRFFSEVSANRPDITLSLGAASFPADADNATELLERARDALNEARSMGRNRVWCYLRRPRVPLEVPVFFDATDPLLVGYTRDLSPSGIFVQTSAPIDVGMRCALAFPLPGIDGKVHVIGRVVRMVLPQLQAEMGDLRIPGIGVEFERFSGRNDRRAIESFLHRHEAHTLRPESGPLSV